MPRDKTFDCARSVAAGRRREFIWQPPNLSLRSGMAVSVPYGRFTSLRGITRLPPVKASVFASYHRDGDQNYSEHFATMYLQRRRTSFSETQFEGYRCLDEHVGDKPFRRAIIGDLAEKESISLGKWFPALGKSLLELRPRSTLPHP